MESVGEIEAAADKLAEVVSQVPHVSATIIPFNLTGTLAERGRLYHRIALSRDRESSREFHVSKAPLCWLLVLSFRPC